MSAQYQASNVKAPFDKGNAANDFNVRLYDCDTTHKVTAVPYSFTGKYVRIFVAGGDLHYAFSESSSAEVDRAVAGTDAGASDKVGDIIKDGTSDHVRLPSVKDESVTLYFVREASVDNTTARMRLASD